MASASKVSFFDSYLTIIFDLYLILRVILFRFQGEVQLHMNKNNNFNGCIKKIVVTIFFDSHIHFVRDHE